MGNSLSRRADVVVQIAEWADKTDKADYAAKGFRAIAGVQSFRKYSWMTDAVGTNWAGNLRGIVVSSRWRTVHTVVSKTADVVGTIAAVSALASNLVDLAPQFEAVYNSTDNAWIKAGKYSGIASSLAQRTLAGTISSGVHLIYLPLIFACDEISKTGVEPHVKSTATACANVLRNADALISSSIMYVTDPSNQERVVQTYVNVFIR